jgi:hypothetical protein
MATGPEHYREAEKHIGFAQNSDAPDVEALHLGYAQAHATLALTAATVLATTYDPAVDHEIKLWVDTVTTEPAFKDADAQREDGTFDLDDVVNVSDPEHEYFGVRGTVVALCDSGQVLIMTGRSGTTLGLPASSLTLHATFVAQMAAADAAGQAADDRRLLAAELDAAEQQAAKDAEAADDVYTAEERADDDAWAEAAADYAASLEPGLEANL